MYSKPQDLCTDKSASAIDNENAVSQTTRPETSGARFSLPAVASEGAAGAMGGDWSGTVGLAPIHALVRDPTSPSGMRWGYLLPVGAGYRFFTSAGMPGLDDIVEHLKVDLSISTPGGVVTGLGLRVGYLHYGSHGARG